MRIHKIHDLSNKEIIDILIIGLSENDDDNYSPKKDNINSNLFYILNDKNGRYNLGSGAYYILENNGEYVASAGWNKYELDSNIALLITRMFVSKPYRANYYVGEYILPTCIEETTEFTYQWITFNDNNVGLYKWFERSQEGKSPSLYRPWPDIYKTFVPIGKKNIYYTDQYVVELQK